MKRIQKIKNAFDFFVGKEQNKETFTLEELEINSGWKLSTIKSYITKKWSQFIVKEANGNYRTIGVTSFPYSSFIKLHSQKTDLFSDILKPELPEMVDELVNKSRESALLAVQVYNNPFSAFRTHGYIVFMVIAYTSLFHAYFEKNKKDYFYHDQSGAYKYTNSGEKKAWDISECVKQFYSVNNSPEKANLELLIELRDRIEHRFLPAIDWDLVGHCQAALLNFEQLLINNFGEYFALNQSLTFALQFSSVMLKQQILAKKKRQAQNYSEIKEFIKQYQSGLPDEILVKPEYCFRVFLIPILGNHAKSADHCIQFVNYNTNDPLEMEQYEKDIVMFKSKLIPAVNVGKYRAQMVCDEVQKRINKPFRVRSEHFKAWRMYKVRSSSQGAEGCNPIYCQFDEVHRDYVYTQEWIDFLVLKLKVDKEYERLTSFGKEPNNSKIKTVNVD